MKTIDVELLNRLSAQAKASERLRMNYNFHQSLDDKCHRMLNAVEPGTQVPIHRHPTKDEHRCLELKKTTGELQDGMHSACAFLNTEGGLLIFGVAPTSLKILGQQVTDSTQRKIAQALAGLYPAVEVKPEYIDVPGRC